MESQETEIDEQYCSAYFALDAINKENAYDWLSNAQQHENQKNVPSPGSLFPAIHTNDIISQIQNDSS